MDGLEEDSFSGDGLERERQWVEQFRERRAGSRSNNNNRSGSSGLNNNNKDSSSSSSKDSSRYSFSTEFSSGIVDPSLYNYVIDQSSINSSQIWF